MRRIGNVHICEIVSSVLLEYWMYKKTGKIPKRLSTMKVILCTGANVAAALTNTKMFDRATVYDQRPKLLANNSANFLFLQILISLVSCHWFWLRVVSLCDHVYTSCTRTWMRRWFIGDWPRACLQRCTFFQFFLYRPLKPHTTHAMGAR